VEKVLINLYYLQILSIKMEKLSMIETIRAKDVIILTFMIMVFSGFFYSIFSQHNWVWRVPFPQGNGLISMTWSGSRYVAVGEGGSVITSTDAKTWTMANSKTHNKLNGIIWTGSFFVAVGHSGTIITSMDGINWILRESGTDPYLLSITWGNSKLVAVGGFGVALYSTDGLVWHPSTKNTQSQLRSVVWTGKRFIAVGMDKDHYGPGNGMILTSEDGISWVKRNRIKTDLLNSIAWNGQIACAVGIGNMILTSVDGILWKTNSIDDGGPMSFVVWTGKEFIAGGYRDSVFVSSNAANWRPYKTNRNEYATVFYVNNNMFALTNTVLMSKDGIIWDNSTDTVQNGAMRAIAWSGTLYVAVGDNGIALISIDGTIWKKIIIGTDKVLNSIVWTGNQFVAVGETAGIFTSSDGEVWTQRVEAMNSNYKAVIKADNKIVVVGNRIATSTDGMDWTIRYRGNNATAAAYGKSLIAVTCRDGNILTSKNGVDWDVRKTGTSIPLNTIIWNGAKFVAFGSRRSNGGSDIDGDSVAISDDGINWVAHKSNLHNDIWYTIFWSGNQFVLISANGDMSASSDGIVWHSFGFCPSTYVTSAVWNGKMLVAVGGGILTCQPEKGF